MRNLFSTIWIIAGLVGIGVLFGALDRKGRALLVLLLLWAPIQMTLQGYSLTNEAGRYEIEQEAVDLAFRDFYDSDSQLRIVSLCWLLENQETLPDQSLISPWIDRNVNFDECYQAPVPETLNKGDYVTGD